MIVCGSFAHLPLNGHVGVLQTVNLLGACIICEDETDSTYFSHRHKLVKYPVEEMTLILEDVHLCDRCRNEQRELALMHANAPDNSFL